MTSRYAYSLHEQAALELVAADDAARKELLTIFERLARQPGLRAAETVVDKAGRTNEVAYSEQFRVVYWADHAVKEVRIMDVRRY